MALRLFNTLTGKKEIVKPGNKKKLRLFVCGPTVYDHTHLGHARTYIFFDFLAKYLRSQGHALFYLQNITDVDDKIIKRSRTEKKNPLRLADFFTKEYLKDMKALGIDAVDAYAPASKFIPHIIRQVERLVEKELAYKIEGDGYYFNIGRFPDYGKLSKRTAEQAEDAISRIDESIKKKNRGDFALWKLAPDADLRGLDADKRRRKFAIINGEPLWNTRLGWGRPGWHIEDTAISEYYFGPQYDIHGGGVDLKFPHHEAEIAQQEGASGKKPFVKTWLHTGTLRIGGEKMSKSLCNFISIKDFLRMHPAAPLRLFFFSHHYRSPVLYEEKFIEDAENTLAGINSFWGKLDFLLTTKSNGGGTISFKKYAEQFSRALADDANTPEALAAIFDFINDVNKIIWGLNPASARLAKKFTEESFLLFGIKLSRPKIPLKIKQSAAQREKFRRNQQFIQSDALRKEMSSLGYIIEDTERGPFVWPATS